MISGLSGNNPVFGSSERLRSPAQENAANTARDAFRAERDAAQNRQAPPPPDTASTIDPERVRERFNAQQALLRRDDGEDLPLRNRQALESYNRISLSPADPGRSELLGGVDISV